MTDGFESRELDVGKWWTGRVDPGRYWIDQRVVRSAVGALAVRVESGDSHYADQSEREEIRTAPGLHCPFGSDLWYRFSFRVEGETSQMGSNRWVIGQWKQEGDGSPFLAQRFDNRVFHITVQDNNCRITIAKAQGDPFGTMPKEIEPQNRPKIMMPVVSPPDCNTNIQVQYGVSAALPDPHENWVDMDYRVRGGRNGTGIIQIWANKRFIARVSGSIGYDTGGNKQYFKIGIYRDAEPGSAIIYFDDFTREPFRR